MPYYTGTANSFTELRTALFDACTAEGWALNSEILSKGDAFVKVTVNTVSISNLGIGIVLQGGTGRSGSTLLNPSPSTPRLGPPQTVILQPSFPMDYDIHIHDDADEVYFIARFNSSYHYWLAFGLSSIDSLPGTGLWLSGTSNASSGPNGVAGIYCYMDEGGSGNLSTGCIFWDTRASAVSQAYNNQDTVHIDIDGVDWAGNPDSTSYSSYKSVEAISTITYLLQVQPNAWNGDAILHRIQPLYSHSSLKRSLVCDLAHARYLRIDNYNSGDIITLGSDKWKVYPFYRKDTTNRNGGSQIDHTGTFGWAIRYDGV